MSAKDQRKAIRKQGEALVCFEGDNFSIFSKLHDVSSTGAFIATHYLLDPGTKVTISFMSGELKGQKKKATVVHSSDSKQFNGQMIVGLGLSFDV